MVEEENPQIDKSPVNDLEAHEELDLAKNGQVSDELLESTEASAEKGGFDVVDADITNNLATADQPDLEKPLQKKQCLLRNMKQKKILNQKLTFQALTRKTPSK